MSGIARIIDKAEKEMTPATHSSEYSIALGIALSGLRTSSATEPALSKPNSAQPAMATEVASGD